MARINVEESVWKDSRYTDLCIMVGCRWKAIGLLVAAWRLAQEYWKPEKSKNHEGRQPIPADVWARERFPDAIIECGWFERLNDGTIRAHGADDAFGWLLKCSAGGSAPRASIKQKSTGSRLEVDSESTRSRLEVDSSENQPEVDSKSTRSRLEVDSESYLSLTQDPYSFKIDLRSKDLSQKLDLSANLETGSTSDLEPRTSNLGPPTSASEPPPAASERCLEETNGNAPGSEAEGPGAYSPTPHPSEAPQRAGKRARRPTPEAAPGSLTLPQIVALWNAHKSSVQSPCEGKLPKQVSELLLDRAKNYPNPEQWERAIREIAAWDWANARGAGNRGWIADISYLGTDKATRWFSGAKSAPKPKREIGTGGGKLARLFDATSAECGGPIDEAAKETAINMAREIEEESKKPKRRKI